MIYPNSTANPIILIKAILEINFNYITSKRKFRNANTSIPGNQNPVLSLKLNHSTLRLWEERIILNNSLLY